MNNLDNTTDKYCLGCGIKLQDENILTEGYVADL